MPAASTAASFLGLPPATLSKEVHRLREETRAHRLRLDQEKAAHEALVDKLAARPVPTILSDFLPSTGGEEEAPDEPTAVVQHASRMEALQRELIAQGDRVGRLKTSLAELQSAAANDTNSLAALLRSSDLTSHQLAAGGGDASASEEPDTQVHDTRVLLAAKRELADTLERQAEEAEALLHRKRTQKAAAARFAAAAAERSRVVQHGSTMQRWDAERRVLRECHVSLLADGRTFHCVETAQPSSAPLRIAVDQVESVAPIARRDAVAAPGHAWLYFTVRWRDAAGDAPAVLGRPASLPALRCAHFACDTRSLATAWIVGLSEAKAAANSAPAAAWTVGGVLWQQVRAMVDEQARATGRRPLQVLAAAVLHASADMRLVRGEERLAQSMLFSLSFSSDPEAAPAGEQPPRPAAGADSAAVNPAPAAAAPSARSAGETPPLTPSAQPKVRRKRRLKGTKAPAGAAAAPRAPLA